MIGMATIQQKAISAYELLMGSLDLGSFDNRLKFQKTIYLLKLFGTAPFQELNFTWYKRGPYCFELGGILSKENVKSALQKQEKESILKHNKIITQLISDEKKAELTSSVAFLVFDEKLSGDEVIKRMSLTKPWFSEDEVKETLINVKKIFTN